MGITITPGTAGSRIVDIDRAVRTASDLTLNSTSVANLDTGLDITLSGVVTGNVVRVWASGVYGSQDVTANLYVATIVSGSPVNYFSSGSSTPLPIAAWSKELTTEDFQPIAGVMEYVLQSGDISSGSVTLRLRYKTGTASNLTLFANSAAPFHWGAEAIHLG